MCKWNKHGDTRIDPCMRKIVKFINQETSYQTIMCCCGHKKEIPSSLIVIDKRVAEFCNRPFDIFSGFQFKHNQKRFYKRDKKGFYYIPEITGDEK